MKKSCDNSASNHSQAFSCLRSFTTRITQINMKRTVVIMLMSVVFMAMQQIGHERVSLSFMNANYENAFWEKKVFGYSAVIGREVLATEDRWRRAWVKRAIIRKDFHSQNFNSEIKEFETNRKITNEECCYLIRNKKRIFINGFKEKRLI